MESKQQTITERLEINHHLNLRLAIELCFLILMFHRLLCYVAIVKG